jgi:hypothetical protein
MCTGCIQVELGFDEVQRSTLSWRTRKRTSAQSEYMRRLLIVQLP